MIGVVGEGEDEGDEEGEEEGDEEGEEEGDGGELDIRARAREVGSLHVIMFSPCRWNASSSRIIP